MGDGVSEGDGERNIQQLVSVRGAWELDLAIMGIQGDKAPLLKEFGIKGWQVDYLTFIDLPHIVPTVIPLRPVEHTWPFGDGANASKQLHAWEKEFGGPVVYLLVSDEAQPGDNPMLIAPVLRSWLTKEEPVDFLGMKYYETSDEAMHKSYRAAIIARIGKRPEELWPTEIATLDFHPTPDPSQIEP